MNEKYSTNVLGIQYRKMIVDKYLVFYVVLEDTIEIHRIINSKMDIKRIIK
ncbi:MAG: hypothetical protein N4A63_09580 [Vallitalea sp.]|jgi:plasmid stabilization system protein ParE|nr:hypothetical protein [Vallitalea sp.]